MAKKSSGDSEGRSSHRQSLIGAIGGVIIGAAILLFVCTMVLTSLSDAAYPHSGVTAAEAADWLSLNNTIEQLRTFLSICSILLGILGIVLIGSSIIASIGGGFGT
jgi:hypothetical protein